MGSEPSKDAFAYIRFVKIFETKVPAIMKSKYRNSTSASAFLKQYPYQLAADWQARGMARRDGDSHLRDASFDLLPMPMKLM